MTLVIPVNHEADSIDQLQLIEKRLTDACSYVVLRNAVHDDKFAVYDQSVVRKHLRKDLGMKEINMTRLQPWLVWN